MPKRQATFRGLNTDLPAERVPSGTAVVATNVVLEGGKIVKRAGFDQWDADVNDAGATNGVLNMVVVTFGSGATYVVCKVAEAAKGFLYHRRVDSGGAAATFTKITDLWTGHSKTERGSFFFWADRLHYTDTTGMTKWYPGSVWKGGIPAGSAPTVSATTGGQKEGRYHYFQAYRDSRTGQEGLTGAASASVECRLDGNSAISITDVTAVASLPYEANQYVGYCTMGGTEYIGKGSAGVEVWSYRAYPDKYVGTSWWTAKKADSVLDKTRRMSTRWGLPPSADIVAYDGVQAVYAGASAGIVNFSIPRYPTAIPHSVAFSLDNGANTHYLEPEPWESWLQVAGRVTELNSVAGLVAMYFDNQTWALLHPDGSSRFYPRLVSSGHGCAAHGASVATVSGIHAMGFRCWTVLTSRGLLDLSYDRFVTTLETIPVANINKTRMAEYAFKGQVWASVVPAGVTHAQRILVWDSRGGGLDDESRRAEGALTIFDVAGMVAGEDITSMCEMAYAGAEPTMLVGTSEGRILQYPSLVGDENAAGTRVHYAAEWRGYIGTEGLMYEQSLGPLRVHAGANCSANVTMSYRPRRTGDETVTAFTQLLDRSSAVVALGMFCENPNGNFFEIGFSSLASVTTRWTVTDVTWQIKRTDSG